MGFKGTNNDSMHLDDDDPLRMGSMNTTTIRVSGHASLLSSERPSCVKSISGFKRDRENITATFELQNPVSQLPSWSARSAGQTRSRPQLTAPFYRDNKYSHCPAKNAGIESMHCLHSSTTNCIQCRV